MQQHTTIHFFIVEARATAGTYADWGLHVPAIVYFLLSNEGSSSKREKVNLPHRGPPQLIAGMAEPS